MQVITRDDAKAQGMTTYFTGKPCRHGHITERFTVNQRCRECARVDSLRRYHADAVERTRKTREYQRQNKDRVLAKHREWIAANKERVRQKEREWEARNPDKKKVIRINNDAKRRGAPGRITVRQWRSLLREADHKCMACGSPDNLTSDHIVPICKGGENRITNLQVLCLDCNRKKHRRIIDYRKKEQAA